LYITDNESLKLIFNNCDISLKKHYEEAKEVVFDKKEYTNSSIWTIPLISINDKKYKSNDWWKTINWVRYPRFNYQRQKTKAYWTDSRLEYQWSKIVSIEKVEDDVVVDIEIDWDHLFRVDTILSHNTWKTRLAIYIAIRQLMLPQQLVLYILPNKEWFSEQPFFYIEKMFDNLKNSEGIDGNIPWLQFNNKTFKVTNKETKSKILFISSQWGTKWGRSFSANLIMMDEAGYNDDPDIYDISYSATTDTRWRMFAISTINKDTPINWFFYKKIDLDGGSDSIVMVVDIYQNEFIPEEEKRKLEEKHKVRNPKIWLAEYMAIFVWQGDMFDISGFFRLDFEYDVLKFNDFSFNFYKKLDKYQKFVIWRDPWRTLDPWGLSIIGIVNRNEAELICTWYIRVPNYIIQMEVVLEIYKFLKQQRETNIVIDVGKAGIGMFDLLNSRQMYPYWVQSTGSGTINNPSPRLYNIGNNVLEWNLKNIMNTKTLNGFSWLDNIRHEYETFEASKTRQWTNHHHDILSSLMIATTICLERNWLSFRKEYKEEEKTNEVLIEDIIYNMHQRENSGTSKFMY